jgi:ABC-type Mn2+/Zn2+ transport system permease subunit
MLHWLTEPFREPTNLRALIEVTLLGITGGVLGTWLVLYRMSYGAESLAHGMLPGLVIASLAGFPLLIGGAAGLLVAALATAFVARIEELERDTAIGVVVTALLGLGALLALSPDTPAGLQQLLFGDVLGVTGSDLFMAAGLVVIVGATLAVMRPRLLIAGFDRTYAPTLGVSPTLVDAVLMALLALTLLIAVQGLGNLLVVAVLIAPAAAARLITRRVGPMMGAAAVIAVVAGFAGLVASYYLRIASGATIALAFVSGYLLLSAIRRRLS